MKLHSNLEWLSNGSGLRQGDYLKQSSFEHRPPIRARILLQGVTILLETLPAPIVTLGGLGLSSWNLHASSNPVHGYFADLAPGARKPAHDHAEISPPLVVTSATSFARCFTFTM
jgi:hypothetical protein